MTSISEETKTNHMLNCDRVLRRELKNCLWLMLSTSWAFCQPTCTRKNEANRWEKCHKLVITDQFRCLLIWLSVRWSATVLKMRNSLVTMRTRKPNMQLTEQLSLKHTCIHGGDVIDSDRAVGRKVLLDPGQAPCLLRSWPDHEKSEDGRNN